MFMFIGLRTWDALRNRIKERKKENRTSIKMATDTSSCPICFEEFERQGFARIGICSHECCVTCLRKWFASCEGMGLSSPTCPRCRQEVSADEASRVLGRRYVSSSFAKGEGGGERQTGIEEVDEFTLVTLRNMDAKACGNCGVWIVREEGCSSMQCLCGHRFCMDCGLGFDRCPCDDGDGNSPSCFFDNLLRQEYSTTDPIEQATHRVAARSEVRDLRSFIERQHRRVDNFHRGIEAREQKKIDEIICCVRYLFAGYDDEEETQSDADPEECLWGIQQLFGDEDQVH